MTPDGANEPADLVVAPEASAVARPRVAVVLSGGGARGAFQVGAYERLIEDARFARGPGVLSGTSAGAINAALIAAGKTPAEMMEFWRGISRDPPVVASAEFFDGAVRTLGRLTARELLRWLSTPATWRTFLRHASHHLPPRRGSVLAAWVEYLLASRFELVSHFLAGIEASFVADTAPLRARLVEVLGGERVPSSDLRLAINTVDAHTGRVVRFVTGGTPLTRSPDYVVVDAITVDMVLASASIPLLFNPVPIGSRLLWDGGLLVNTPLAPAVALGADQIITVLVTESHRGAGPLKRFGRAVERTADAILENAYNVDRMLLLERNRLAKLDGSPYRDVRLYEALRPAQDRTLFVAGSYLDFQRPLLAAMFRAGQRAATEWLKQGPPVDRLDARQDVTWSVPLQKSPEGSSA